MTETRSLRIFALTLPHAEPVEARGSAPYPGFAGTSPRGGGLRTVNLPLYIRVPREGGGPDPFAQVVIDPAGPLPSCHCEALRAEATQGNINQGSRQSPSLLRCARNDAERR